MGSAKHVLCLIIRAVGSLSLPLAMIEVLSTLSNSSTLFIRVCRHRRLIQYVKPWHTREAIHILTHGNQKAKNNTISAEHRLELLNYEEVQQTASAKIEITKHVR
ncbi:hypothetical protein HBI07_188280 [Parastagonospora nodorum]|nr:hypothetical protein HBI07_188280 [Parastagonospora nodorum]